MAAYSELFNIVSYCLPSAHLFKNQFHFAGHYFISDQINLILGKQLSYYSNYLIHHLHTLLGLLISISNHHFAQIEQNFIPRILTMPRYKSKNSYMENDVLEAIADI